MADINIVPFLAPAASVVAMCVSGYFAWLAINVNRKDRESKNHLDQAILSLQRAHAALTDDGRCEHARPDRLVWLNAARHIETYKVLKRGVTELSHKVICEDHEEYWRHRVYLAIDMHALYQPGWYDEDRTTGKLGLAPPSLLIIYGFASWPEGKIDPIDQADLIGIAASHDVRKGNHGLRIYLKKFPIITSLLGEADAKRNAWPKR